MANIPVLTQAAIGFGELIENWRGGKGAGLFAGADDGVSCGPSGGWGLRQTEDQ
ncbi:MAG: hypothetical protein HC853_03135 [Anaerolineae bacterium]|nr:hypothetical protein [Anaerolineae bacterium]